jgi:hypothetical protein
MIFLNNRNNIFVGRITIILGNAFLSDMHSNICFTKNNVMRSFVCRYNNIVFIKRGQSFGGNAKP